MKLRLLRDERRLNKVDKLKKNEIVIGDTTNIDLLREEIERADVVIATTESDKKNLLIALLSKSLGAKKSI